MPEILAVSGMVTSQMRHGRCHTCGPACDKNSTSVGVGSITACGGGNRTSLTSMCLSSMPKAAQLVWWLLHFQPCRRWGEDVVLRA